MHVLLIPFGSAGDVHPFIGIAQALRSRGHRVTFLLNEYFGPLVRGLGFESVPLGDDHLLVEVTKNPDLWHPKRGFRLVMEGALEGARRIYRLIAERREPGETVLVAGSLAIGARLAQEKFGIPLATVHLQPSIFRSVHETPISGELAMKDWWPKPLKRSLYWLIDTLVVDRLLTRGLNVFRAELGLSPVRRAMHSWWNSPQLVLGLFPDWFGPRQPDWPPQVRLTGFPLYDERDVVPLDTSLAAFLDAGPPPLAFTPGSAMRHGRPFFEAALDACRRLGRRGLFLTRFPEQLPGDRPEDVRHSAYAPFSLLLPRVSALVHHGGIGTTAQALAVGTPQLVMPMAYDQFDNAARLRRLGVGLSLPVARFRGPAVAEALQDLLDSAEVSARCREIAGRFRDTRPLDEACVAIETLAVPLASHSRA